MANEDLVEMRKKLGLTQKQLAEKIGMTDRAIAGYELGRRYDGKPQRVPKVYVLALKYLLLHPEDDN